MSENQNNTVSLYDLISIFLLNIRFIILFSIIGVVISIFYFQSQSNVYKAVIEVKSISDREFEKLSGINQILKPKLTHEKIQQYFLHEFNTYISLENEIFNSLRKSEINKSEAELRIQALDLARDYQLVPKQGDDQFQYPKITFFTDDKNSNEKVELLKAATKEINLKVKNDILFLASIKINEIEREINNEINGIERNLKNIERRYTESISSKLNYLKEQTEIAKVIDLEIGEKVVLLESLGYLRGYLVLDKEIEILSRKNNEENIKNYDSNYIFYIERLEEINNDNTIKLSKDELEIFSEVDFNSVNIDLRLIKYEKYLSTVNIFVSITVGILFGFFLAFLIAIFRHTYQNYKEYKLLQDNS